jgi:protein gp37
LRQVPAQMRFISFEPLLGPVGRVNLKGVHWAIVGGESGPRARPMEQGWIDAIHAQCERAGTPFFFKQWGGKNRKSAGREWPGRTWDAMPATAG